MTNKFLSAYLEPDFLKKLEQFRVVAKRHSCSVGKGEHPSARRGTSLEFSDYRKYHRGDDLRYVDWNIYRRLDRLLLKLFTGEEELSIYIMIDVSRSMAAGDPAKIDYAKRIAAALGYIGLKSHDKVAAVSFSSDIESYLPLGRGRRQILSLFKYIEDLHSKGETDLQTSVKTFTLRFPRRGLVVLLSDLFDPRGCRTGLEELIKGKYEVLVIHLLDPADLRLEPWGNVSLLDVEGERERDVFIDSELARRFSDELNRYMDEIAQFCLGHNMDYFRTPITIPFEDFVLRYIRQGMKVR